MILLNVVISFLGPNIVKLRVYLILSFKAVSRHRGCLTYHVGGNLHLKLLMSSRLLFLQMAVITFDLSEGSRI